MPQWEADIEVGVELVRSLLAEQFPDLDASSARLLGEGWDNSVWAVEEYLAFRFPRRAVAVPLVERELAVLPRLAPLLSVPIPVPAFVGEPSGEFPWPFFGAQLLAGGEPAGSVLTEANRVELGAELGRFLKVLHAPATRQAVDPDGALPVDPNRREDMSLRVERTREQVGALAAAGVWQAPAGVERLLATAEQLRPPAAARVLAHGDLHVRHVLVEDGSLSGVIDWGDVCVADPSIDLSLVWSLLSPAGRERFLVEYGPVDEETRLRARVLALQLSSLLALYAHDVGHGSLECECLAGLERALVDWDG